MTNQLLLSKQLQSHTGEVRCGCVLGNNKFVTGGLDAACVVWGDLFRGPSKTIYGNSDFIYAVCAHPFNNDWFLTGSKDKTVTVFDSVSGEKIMALDTHIVHSGPVCSLSAANNVVAVGSWDGSFSVWNLDTGELVYHINNAGTYAVTVAIDEKNNTVITGSQDKAINFFTLSEGKRIHSIHNAHSDIIRSIYVDPIGIVITGSNDTCIKIWNRTTTSYSDLALIGTLEGHENFVFSIDSANGVIVSASEDKTVRLWSLHDLTCIQTIAHPGTVWFAKLITANIPRIFTGCSDGIVRIFSPIQSEAASSEEREAFASLAAAEGEKEQVDPNTVPDEHEMTRWPGKKVGDIKMFKDSNNVVFAYQWTAQGGWEKIGLVTGSGSGKKMKKKTYGGDQYFIPGDYDYIFDVELGESRMALLPFNEGDNPLVTAEKFCARETINKANISQIIDFIKANTGVTAHSVSSKTSLSSQPLTSYTHFPLSSPILFREAKWPQLLAKLQEVNSQLDEAARLSIPDMSLVEHIISFLQKPPSYSSQDLRPVDIQIVHSTLLNKFPPEALFVVFDLWRMFVLNAGACTMYKDSNGGSQYLITAAKYLQANSSNNTGMCAARYLANIFSQSVPKWAAVENYHLFVPTLVTVLSIEDGVSKNTQLACAAALANVASATTEKATSKFVEMAKIIGEHVLSILTKPHVQNIDADVMYRLLIALGCAIIGARGSFLNRKNDVTALLNSITRPESAVRECISEIQKQI